jgi:hypothetical protein
MSVRRVPISISQLAIVVEPAEMGNPFTDYQLDPTDDAVADAHSPVTGHRRT